MKMYYDFEHANIQNIFHMIYTLAGLNVSLLQS
jgi:hypothetical protein